LAACCIVTLALLGAGRASAQAPGDDGVETDPIRCWWRTSVPAVRVGEPFSIVLTCGVVETETVTVVPNQTELDPNAVQLPPLDVLGGSQGRDLRTADHRFFQYEYRVRLVSEDMFGKDLKLPVLGVSYKVRTRVNGEALEGRDLSYVLPETSVRVLSLVPGDASDIRDATPGTFTEIDQGLARANILRVLGGLLFGFAGLAGFVGVMRVVQARHAGRAKPDADGALVSDQAVLRAIGRELSGLEAARQRGEWTPALTARLLTAIRLISGYALELPARAISAKTSPDAAARDALSGQLAVRRHGFRTGTVAVPAWVTPAVVAEARERLERAGGSERRLRVLEELQDLMTRLTAALYGRDRALDEAVIEEAFASGRSILRRLRLENLWLAKKLRALPIGRAALEHRVWAP
jgi:hypothetical protein